MILEHRFIELAAGANQVIAEHKFFVPPWSATPAHFRNVGARASRILATSVRLTALAGLIENGDGKEWTIRLHDRPYRLVNEALLRAAARAPLFEAATVGEVAFDPDTFLPIAMEEAETKGNA